MRLCFFEKPSPLFFSDKVKGAVGHHDTIWPFEFKLIQILDPSIDLQRFQCGQPFSLPIPASEQSKASISVKPFSARKRSFFPSPQPISRIGQFRSKR